MANEIDGKCWKWSITLAERQQQDGYAMWEDTEGNSNRIV